MQWAKVFPGDECVAIFGMAPLLPKHALVYSWIEKT